jgi:predicted AlkP superfamily pyrophosphatase or phosphodiesterase
MADAASIGYSEASRYLHISRGEFDRRWEEGKRAENPLDDPVNHLRKILAVTRSVESIGAELLREGAEVTAIYFEGPDTMAHRFGHLMPPRLPWVSAEDFAMGKDVLPRYYEEVDRLTARLLKAAPPDALWIINSDHGFFTGEARLSTRPASSRSPAVSTRRNGRPPRLAI